MQAVARASAPLIDADGEVTSAFRNCGEIATDLDFDCRNARRCRGNPPEGYVSNNIRKAGDRSTVINLYV